MCGLCEASRLAESTAGATFSTRRRLLKSAVLVSLTGAMGFTAGLARAQSSPPNPSNVISPDEALDRLMKGNERYVKGDVLKIDVASAREALSSGQNPFACIVSCADSRIGPELCFNTGRGDLFVTRVAGNFVTPDILASLEYGTAVLESPLIMVLGHTGCGAVNAAISAYTKNTAYPGHIQLLTTAIAPAVRAIAQSGKPVTVEDVTKENVLLNVIKLKESNPIISERVTSGKLKVVGAIYDMPTGRVELI